MDGITLTSWLGEHLRNGWESILGSSQVTVTVTILKTISHKYSSMPWYMLLPVNILMAFGNPTLEIAT